MSTAEQRAYHDGSHIAEHVLEWVRIRRHNCDRCSPSMVLLMHCRVQPFVLMESTVDMVKQHLLRDQEEYRLERKNTGSWQTFTQVAEHLAFRQMDSTKTSKC